MLDVEDGPELAIVGGVLESLLLVNPMSDALGIPVLNKIIYYLTVF